MLVCSNLKSVVVMANKSLVARGCYSTDFMTRDLWCLARSSGLTGGSWFTISNFSNLMFSSEWAQQISQVRVILLSLMLQTLLTYKIDKALFSFTVYSFRIFISMAMLFSAQWRIDKPVWIRPGRVNTVTEQLFILPYWLIRKWK